MADENLTKINFKWKLPTSEKHIDFKALESQYPELFELNLNERE